MDLIRTLIANRGGITFTPDIINTLPLPQVSEEKKKALIQYSDDMIKGRIEFSEGMNRINSCVSEIYGLDKKDILCIHNFFEKPQSKKDDIESMNNTKIDEEADEDARE